VSCGGLLDDLRLAFNSADNRDASGFRPHCLIGPNGSGKSQLLQLIAEIFQSAWHEHSAEEEREVADTTSSFELEYLASRGQAQDHAHVRLRRRKANRPHAIEAAVLEDGEWREVPIGSAEIRPLLPSVVVGYTSGDNETLSLPFFVSRSGY
jgi:predicted ATP-dependent endonuclease of OLD family